jgi:hypothetical protein
MTSNVLDDLFHACALEAFLTLAAERRDWPACEETRHLAFALYEIALSEKNGAKR